MSNLREQFEAWYLDHPLHTSFERDGDGYKSIGADVAWDAFQAGHAVNADLLAALLHIKQAFCDSPAHGALACEMASIATEAIKKARGE